MARPKTNKSTSSGLSSSESSNSSEHLSDDFADDLIKSINKEMGHVAAYNLSTDDAPVVVKRWYPTGSRQLDCIISNRGTGGLPEGRIVEISGNFGSGKSTVAQCVARSVQRMGGIIVYLDTENATSVENLAAFGIDVSKRFVFAQPESTEEVFKIAELAINKVKNSAKDAPVLIVWDSVAATSPQDELEGNYDQNTIGLQARVIGKGLRKITGLIAEKNVVFLMTNQQRMKIGVAFGDPTTTTGGMAIPYACSTRIQLSPGSQLKDQKTGEVYGIEVKAKTIKNKVGRPFRSVSFQIHFGRGIVEDENVFDIFREFCDKNPKGVPVPETKERVLISGAGAWKSFTIMDSYGVVKDEVKFYKADFGKEVLYNPKYSAAMDALFYSVFHVESPKDLQDHVTFDSESANNPEYNKQDKDEV